MAPLISLSVISSLTFAQYPSSYLNLTFSELQTALGKVNGPVSFALRPGSAQGTREARLSENAGIVQAAGSPGNLSVVVLWLPVDKGKLAGVRSRQYLEAFVRLLTDEGGPVVRWVEQVLERAVTENGGTPYLESQLIEERQFKATYVPTLSPPMVSLTVSAEGQGTPP